MLVTSLRFNRITSYHITSQLCQSTNKYVVSGLGGNKQKKSIIGINVGSAVDFVCTCVSALAKHDGDSFIPPVPFELLLPLSLPHCHIFLTRREDEEEKKKKEKRLLLVTFPSIITKRQLASRPPIIDDDDIVMHP